MENPAKKSLKYWLEMESEILNILMTLTNPFTNDPRVYNEAKSLVKAGHKVTVLAWDKTGKNPVSEKIDGVNVVRSYNTGFMNMLPYDILRLHHWWKKGYKDALELHKKQSFDVIHCHDLDTLPIGVNLKKKLGLPLIYDAHEIWGYMIERDLPKLWAEYYLKKEKKLLEHADQIITVNEPLRDYFSKLSKKPVSIVMNCKELQEKNYSAPKNDKFTLIYIGSLSKPRFLLELVDVVKSLSEVRCIIGGLGKTDYVNSLKKKCSDVKNVEFLGKIPMDKVIPMTKKADAIVCMTSPDDPNNSRATANKQFEAMVCGRPIICTEGTYPGAFTKKEKCGLVSKYTKEDLKRTIEELKGNKKLCEELGKNGLKATIREYNWEKQGEKLLKIYSLLV